MRRVVCGASLLILFLALPSAAVGTRAAVVPAGFTDTRVAALATPQGLAFTPDGRLLVSTQAGFVRVIQNGTLLTTPALDLRPKLCNVGEGGLPGIAVDPNFVANHYVYVYYVFNKSGICETGGTQNSPVNRVSRFVLSDSNVIDPSSEVVLLDNMPSPQIQHIAGDLEFGKDGYLYVSVGDGACDYKKDSGCFAANDASRDQNVLLGKILRITRDGAIPTGNPFTGAGSGRCNTAGMTTAAQCQETWVWGFRNPFRIAFDPNAAGSRLFINDVGEQTWEEIDLAQAGADYGWNVREGPCALASTTSCGPPPVGMTNPVYAYPHTSGCKAVTGGAFVPNGVWPTAYDGSYLFGDYVCGKIQRLLPGGTTVQDFETGLGTGSFISMKFGPTAAGPSLYYTTYANGGEVRRIDFVGSGNRAPTANLTANPTAGVLPLTVSFDGGGSTDPDAGDTLTYMWDFGDGSPSVITSSPQTSHTYTVAGTFIAQLVVRDAAGATSSPVTIRIDAGDAPPAPQINSPAPNGTFVVGQTLNLVGSASDPEDGALPSSALTWEVLLFHVDHTHPFLQPTPGNGIPIVGPRPENLQPSTIANSYLIVKLTATDSIGASTTVTRIVRPNLVNLTLDSSPQGIAIPVNETSFTTPQTFTSWEGLDLDVRAPSQVVQGGVTYLFSSWSDGGTQPVRTITTPAAPASYQAAYQVGGTSTTFNIRGGADDGDVKGAGSSYPPAGAPAVNTTGKVLTAGRRFVFNRYENLVGLLRFDTSAIPDGATVTAATLRLNVTAKGDGDNRNLVAEWYPGTNWPIDASDYTLGSSPTALAGADITSITPGTNNDFPLTGLGSISTTGFTGLRLLVDGGQPSGDNYVQIAAFEHTTLPEAQLIVTYSNGQGPPSNTAPPTISGNAAIGQALTASPGTWSGAQPITFAYQWQRCDAGAVCNDVGGATSSQYAVTNADIGFRLRVQVTASNGSGTATAASAMTGTVAGSVTVTIKVGVGSDDGDVNGAGTTYPPAGAPAANSTGTVLTAGRRFVFNRYENLVGLLRFDTSVLPDAATVTSATLRLRVTGKADADNRNLVAEWYPASNWPIDTSDYALSSSANALAGADITAISVGANNDFALAGLGAISTTGPTAIRLHVDGGQPSGDNYVQMASFEHTTLPEAQLIITYTP